MLFIKSRAKKLNRTYEGLEQKAYNLAKKFESNYNKADTSPALQKHYLDKVEDFLKGQLKREDLEDELRPLAEDLKNEIKNTMSEFKKCYQKVNKQIKLLKV
jgi:acyl carrier protein phosphodiesterase